MFAGSCAACVRRSLFFIVFVLVAVLLDVLEDGLLVGPLAVVRVDDAREVGGSDILNVDEALDREPPLAPWLSSVRSRCPGT